VAESAIHTAIFTFIPSFHMRHLAIAALPFLLLFASGQNAHAAFVTAKLTGVGLGQNTTPGFAGEINWSQAPANNANWINNQFTTFCIEITQHVGINGTYTFETKSLENAPVSPASPMGYTGKADQIRRMWTYAHADSTRLDSNVENAAFQQSIWKILNASFTVDAGLTANVNTFITESNNASNAKANLIALTSSAVQDQIVELKPGYGPHGDEVVPTPAPAALVLLLTGAVPFFVSRRLRGVVA
jgi:hypothetical protein